MRQGHARCGRNGAGFDPLFQLGDPVLPFRVRRGERSGSAERSVEHAQSPGAAFEAQLLAPHLGGQRVQFGISAFVEKAADLHPERAYVGVSQIGAVIRRSG